jgi:hypothetical protein
MLSGDDHDLPLLTRTVPYESTATQNLAVGQVTALGAPVNGSIVPPQDQVAATLATGTVTTAGCAPARAGHAIAATAIISTRR